MSVYIGVGAAVAMVRLATGPAERDGTWMWAQACTDVLWWPLVLLVFLLQRLTAQTSS